jgi:hypothetical protein
VGQLWILLPWELQLFARNPFLSEMQIPVGFPYSESMGDTCSVVDLKNAIRKMIQSNNEPQPDKLMDFARSRN